MKVLYATTFAMGTIASSVASSELVRCPDWEALIATRRSTVVRAFAGSSEDFEGSLARSHLARDGTTGAPLDAANLRGSSSGAVFSTVPAWCSYTVRPSDTLSRIAAAELGDAARYPEIITLNRSTLRDPNVLTVGSTLILPCSMSSAAARQGGAATPAVPSTNQPAPIPTWSARRGDTFIPTMQKWAQTAGYTVVVETAEDWTFAVAISEQGSFVDVLQRVVRGLGAQGTPPAVQIFSNKVVKIGGL